LRISTFTIIAVAGLLATGSYVWADPTTDSGQSQASNDRDTIVCKAGSASTGSHLPGPRECRTKAQWDDIQKQSHDALQDLQNRTLQENKSGG
jgi:hypothetical protein